MFIPNDDQVFAEVCKRRAEAGQPRYVSEPAVREVMRVVRDLATQAAPTQAAPQEQCPLCTEGHLLNAHVCNKCEAVVGTADDLKRNAAAPRVSEQDERVLPPLPKSRNFVHGYSESDMRAYASAALLDLADAIKSLCDDYSSQGGSVYIQDVKSAIDVLTLKGTPAAPVTLMAGVEEHNAAFDKACGKFYGEHGRLPAPIEIFAIASGTPAAQGSELERAHHADYHYLLGLRAGWNLSQQRDVEGFNAALVSRQMSLDEAKKELAAQGSGDLSTSEPKPCRQCDPSVGFVCEEHGDDDEATTYNHACELMEQFQAARAKRGVEVGTQGSLCDGIAWIYHRLEELEAAPGSGVQAEPVGEVAGVWLRHGEAVIKFKGEAPKIGDKLYAASPAPSAAPVGWIDPMSVLNIQRGISTKEWMWAKPEAGNLPVYVGAAPSQVAQGDPSRYPLSEYQPGQWWLESIQKLIETREVDNDTVRAAFVVLNFAATVFAYQKNNS